METALDWFRSYFSDHSHFVFMDGHRSEVGPDSTGDPQGSTLGPLYFSIQSTIRSTTIFMLMTPRFSSIQNQVKMWTHPIFQIVFSEIETWMSNNFLCLNCSKTEVMLLGSPHQLCNAGSLALSDAVGLELKSKLKKSWSHFCCLNLLCRALLRPHSSISEILHICELCCLFPLLKA